MVKFILCLLFIIGHYLCLTLSSFLLVSFAPVFVLMYDVRDSIKMSDLQYKNAITKRRTRHNFQVNKFYDIIVFKLLIYTYFTYSLIGA